MIDGCKGKISTTKKNCNFEIRKAYKINIWYCLIVLQILSRKQRLCGQRRQIYQLLGITEVLKNTKHFLLIKVLDPLHNKTSLIYQLMGIKQVLKNTKHFLLVKSLDFLHNKTSSNIIWFQVWRHMYSYMYAMNKNQK